MYSKNIPFPLKINQFSWTWWCMYLISALGRQKLLDLYAFQAGLVYIASSRATWRDPVSETRTNKRNQLKIPTENNGTLTETKTASIFLSRCFVLGVILRLEGKEELTLLNWGIHMLTFRLNFTMKWVLTPILTGIEKIQRKLDCLIKVIIQLISDRTTNQVHTLKKK